MLGRWTFSRGLLIIFFVSLGFLQMGWAEERYAVKPGDTLFKISKSYGISVEVLKKANGLENNGVKPRQVLLIPYRKGKGKEEMVRRPSVETESYIVKKGENLYSISKRVGLSVEEIKRTNQLQSTTLRSGQVIVLPKMKSEAEEEEEESGDIEEAAEEKLAGVEKSPSKDAQHFRIETKILNKVGGDHCVGDPVK